MTAHDQQTFDERTLQAQFFSRIGFVASQIKDLDFQTFTSIVEHGVRIGNPLAPCVVDADSSLRLRNEVNFLIINLVLYGS